MYGSLARKAGFRTPAAAFQIVLDQLFRCSVFSIKENWGSPSWATSGLWRMAGNQEDEMAAHNVLLVECQIHIARMLMDKDTKKQSLDKHRPIAEEDRETRAIETGMVVCAAIELLLHTILKSCLSCL